MTLVLAVLLAAVALPPTPKFASSIEMVNLQVTVKDPQGRYTTDLREKDFVILENGVKQEIAGFTYKKIPLDLTFLMDGSNSMGPYAKDVYAAAARFIETVQPDTVQLVQFAQFARIVLAPTDDMKEVQGSLAKLAMFSEYGQKLREDDAKRKSKKPEDVIYREALDDWLCTHAMCGSTALYTSVYITADFLKKLSAEDAGTRRQVIILLTDGEDTVPHLTAEDVIAKVAHLDIPIYTVCLRLLVTNEDTGRTDNFLQNLAERTGGEYKIVTVMPHLTKWYTNVGAALQSQYAIRYASSDTKNDGRWRSIQVSVGRAEYEIHAKQGYYAPCDSDQPCEPQR